MKADSNDAPQDAEATTLALAKVTSADAQAHPHAAVRQAATAGERARASEPPRAFEPLIASPDAAELLGNIHIKTLQRYARRGEIPGYQIAGHWYFRASDLDAWLQSQVNSRTPTR